MGFPGVSRTVFSLRRQDYSLCRILSPVIFMIVPMAPVVKKLREVDDTVFFRIYDYLAGNRSWSPDIF